MNKPTFFYDEIEEHKGDGYILPLVITTGILFALWVAAQVFGPERLIEIIASYFA